MSHPQLRVGLACVLLFFAMQTRADLELQGVEGEIARNILTHLRLDDEPCDVPRFRVRQRYRGLEQRVRAAVSPYGFYGPKIKRQLTFAEDCWRVVLEVTLGEPVRVRSLEVKVSGAAQNDSMFAAIDVADYLAVGEVFVDDRYERYKRALADLAQERGYFDAQFTLHRVAVEREALAADVEIEFSSGDRYRYGSVTYGSDRLDERLLSRFPDFASGDFYVQHEVTKLYGDLLATDYFELVNIDKELKPDALVDLNVELIPTKPWGLSTGIGFGTNVGPSITGSVLNRRVNRRGHHMEWTTALSLVEQEVAFDYRLPGNRPASDWYSLYAGFRARDSDAIETVGWHTGVRRGKRLKKNLFETRFVELGEERLREDGVWRRENSLVPGISWSYQLGGRSPRPRAGLRASLELAGATEKILSETSFFRTRLRGKTIFPFGSRSRLLLRGEVGHIVADDFDSVPPSWRFYAGGDASVRGYDYQSLGPEDDDGEATGGSRLLVGSSEFDFVVRGNWSAAVFADGGSVSRGGFGNDFQWSYGIGARWFSPLGPVRVDLAIPQQAGKSFRVHISLGPDL
ncbi:MAG: autotransporter assembly complex protein TamA [Gammaproteobacteria bacterium]|nr:autotransporter assembly complex protein TamA [Gammaproteobacteria bacterium]